MDLQLQGEITKWDDEKGYGFITPLSGAKQVFIHIKAIKRRYQRPQPGQLVYYSLSKDKQGRICAANVTYAGKEHSSPQRKRQLAAACIFVTLFFAALAVLTYVVRLIPQFIIALYAVASVVTFIAYASDKSAAREGRWRTSEATLHLMSFFCGWPGAFLAQQTLRHKSSKEEFQGVYKFTVILNIALTAWLLTPRGFELTIAFLKKLIELIRS
jgi:uncharacterized membrane protein YsdA (DUF1294 family)/cold shock CspA family protein